MDTLVVGRQRTMLRRLMPVAMAGLAAACLAGAAWTLYWSLRFGLVIRPPLPPFAIGLRLTIVGGALALLIRRHDPLERAALVAAILAAASSALYGFGFTGIGVRLARLLFHFVGYALGAVASVRLARASAADA